MSRCAFCGSLQMIGGHSFAHRFAPNRFETVKVCERCVPEAQRAGFAVAEREPRIERGASDELGVTPP